MTTPSRPSMNSRFAVALAVAALAAMALASAMRIDPAPGRFAGTSSAAAEPANARPATSLAAADRRQALAAGRPAAGRTYAWEHAHGSVRTATLEASR